MSIDPYIEKWLNGTLTREEQEAFEKSGSFQKIKKIQDSIDHFRAPAYNTEQELYRFNSTKPSRARGKIVGVRWSRMLLRIAAMLTIVVGSYYYYFYLLPTTIETNVAEKTKFYLPDSSEVILNAVSKIEYHEKGWERERNLNLEGEAFFKVKKGSKFQVTTSSGTVTVIGTQFNIINRNKYFEVVCFEGRVQVTTIKETDNLSASQAFRSIDGKVIRHVNDKETEPAWLHGESSFQSVPYREVLREFERQYQITIVAKDIDTEKTFSGRFPHNDMILALKSITNPHNFTFRITEDQRVILSGELE